jgi:hypothetical protein
MSQIISDLAPTTLPRTPRYLTVGELAAALGQSERSTRQLLNRGLIPGARRMDPGAGRSPWLIPDDAPDLYVRQFYEQAS